MKKIGRGGIVHYANTYDGEWVSVCGASVGRGPPAHYYSDVTCSQCVSLRAKTLVTHRRWWLQDRQVFLRDAYGYYLSVCSDSDDNAGDSAFDNRIDLDEVDDEKPTCIACIAMK